MIQLIRLKTRDIRHERRLPLVFFRLYDSLLTMGSELDPGPTCLGDLIGMANPLSDDPDDLVPATEERLGSAIFAGNTAFSQEFFELLSPWSSQWPEEIARALAAYADGTIEGMGVDRFDRRII